jgi:hypothetical protein
MKSILFNFLIPILIIYLIYILTPLIYSGVKVTSEWNTGPDFNVFKDSEQDLINLRENCQKIPAELSVSYSGVYTNDENYGSHPPDGVFKNYIFNGEIIGIHRDDINDPAYLIIKFKTFIPLFFYYFLLIITIILIGIELLYLLRRVVYQTR